MKPIKLLLVVLSTVILLGPASRCFGQSREFSPIRIILMSTVSTKFDGLVKSKQYILGIAIQNDTDADIEIQKFVDLGGGVEIPPIPNTKTPGELKEKSTIRYKVVLRIGGIDEGDLYNNSIDSFGPNMNNRSDIILVKGHYIGILPRRLTFNSSSSVEIVACLLDASSDKEVARSEVLRGKVLP